MAVYPIPVERLDALIEDAKVRGYYYWKRTDHDQVVNTIWPDHEVRAQDGTVIGRSYSYNWAWVQAFRALGLIPQ